MHLTQTGPRNLITDVAGLRVGNAKNVKAKTGATVLTADAPFVTSYNVMGGGPATRDTELLEPDRSVAHIDALVLTGGSVFGLDTCSGVIDALRAQGRGTQILNTAIPIVPGAGIFDVLSGGDNNWPENLYRDLGRAAFEAADTDFDLGTNGAGTGAMTAMMKGGLGSASAVLENGATVGALAVVNPTGAATTPGDRHFWAAPFEIADEFGGLGPDPTPNHGLRFESRKSRRFVERANTTIAIVATDMDLSKSQCKRLATMAQDGIARACVPAHSPLDGDLVFALTTGAVQPSDPMRDLLFLGHAAAICLARAIARGVYHATAEPNDLLPTWREFNA